VRARDSIWTKLFILGFFAVVYFKFIKSDDAKTNAPEPIEFNINSIDNSSIENNQNDKYNSDDEIVSRKKIKWFDFEIHKNKQGKSNLFNTKSKVYQFKKWYELTYKTGLNPRIEFRHNGKIKSFATFQIAEITDDYIMHPPEPIDYTTESESYSNSPNYYKKKERKCSWCARTFSGEGYYHIMGDCHKSTVGEWAHTCSMKCCSESNRKALRKM